MFDLLTAQEIQRAGQEAAANIISIKMVLYDKGIATVEELDAALVLARQMLDQEVADYKAKMGSGE